MELTRLHDKGEKLAEHNLKGRMPPMRLSCIRITAGLGKSSRFLAASCTLLPEHLRTVELILALLVCSWVHAVYIQVPFLPGAACYMQLKMV